MTKAEEMAYKAYPSTIFGGKEGDSIRASYMLGFNQAHAEYSLTGEDVCVIMNLVRNNQSRFISTTECYEKVAKLFNDARDER